MDARTDALRCLRANSKVNASSETQDRASELEIEKNSTAAAEPPTSQGQPASRRTTCIPTKELRALEKEIAALEADAEQKYEIRREVVQNARNSARNAEQRMKAHEQQVATNQEELNQTIKEKDELIERVKAGISSTRG